MTTGRPAPKPLTAAAVAALAALSLAACTPTTPSTGGDAGGVPVTDPKDLVVPGAGTPLAADGDCDKALPELRRTAKDAVMPWGFFGTPFPGLDPAAISGAHTATAAPLSSAYSGTTVQEAGVDEADRVKTDGRRIVTVYNGVLRVVDARRRAETGRLDLRSGKDDPVAVYPPTLLLHGDRALVLAVPAKLPTRAGRADPFTGPRLTLVDLSTQQPRIIGSYATDGRILGARQVGATARIVVRATPRVDFGLEQPSLDRKWKAIDKAPLSAWLPRYETTDARGRTTAGQVPCGRMVRPTVMDGGSLVTVLTFDLATQLGTGDPVTVLASADFVYATANSLYVAANTRLRASSRKPYTAPPATTRIVKLATTGTPRLVASGTVDGEPVNEYALSEWQDHLRIATTTTTTGDATNWGLPVQTAVRVLRPDGGALVQAGIVDGLGKQERVMAVRYAGPAGYVVTFRQTDPLYVLNLGDPAHPRRTGELKITGYSAYLHPTANDELIGIGQEATERGARTGLQVALFDVRDPARPARIARRLILGGTSAAEFDPHAFLYWPADGTLVIPVNDMAVGGGIIEGDQPKATKAVVLRVGAGTIRDVAVLAHPGEAARASIFRSLVIGDTLWTVSDSGAMASELGGELGGAVRQAWVAWT